MTDNPNLNAPDDQDLEMAFERLAHLVAIGSIYAPPQFDDLRIVRNYIYTLRAARRAAIPQYSKSGETLTSNGTSRDWADIEAMLTRIDTLEPLEVTQAEKQRREHVAALKSRIALAVQAIKDKPLGSNTLPFLIDRVRDIATPGELDNFVTEQDETWLLWRIVVDQAEGLDRLEAQIKILEHNTNGNFNRNLDLTSLVNRLEAQLDQLLVRIGALDDNLAAEQPPPAGSEPGADWKPELYDPDAPWLKPRK